MGRRSTMVPEYILKGIKVQAKGWGSKWEPHTKTTTEATPKLRIAIDMGGAAFDDNPGAEAARILRELADKCESMGELNFETILRDVNGNTVGVVKAK